MAYPRAWTLTVLCSVLLSWPASPASACGGFFCSNAAPVVQTAERIVFVHHDDGTMTAIIEVLYEGPAESFAWVIPAPGVPEVGVSSSVVLDRLQAMTAPVYAATVDYSGDCFSIAGGYGGGGGSGCGREYSPALLSPGPVFSDSADAGASSDAGLPSEPVLVLDSGSIGPYDWVTLSVDPMTADPADEAVSWLENSGFDVSAFGKDRIRPYLEDGQNLLAFRLNKTADAGSIRPVTLRYPAPCPAIPLRPTAVAATDDMGILVWVFGPSRAVPLNYLSVEPNESRLRWSGFGSGTAYRDLVSEAVNESGGRAFVTEMAARVEDFALQSNGLPTLQLRGGGDRDDVEGHLGTQMDWSAVLQLMALFGAFDGMADLVDRYVSFPGGRAYADVVGCPWGCIEPALTSDAAVISDTDAFLNAILDEVIAPIEEAELLINSAEYMTRMFTTMDGAEMTSDPMFDFNAELGDISNVHRANVGVDCDRETEGGEPQQLYSFSQSLRGFGAGLEAHAPGLSSDPAAYRITMHATSGPGIVIADKSVLIQQSLWERWEDTAAVTSPLTEPKGDRCEATASGSFAPLLPFALFGAAGAFVLRRRRIRS